MELAGVFNGLGSQTSLFVRGDKALRTFDPMIADHLHKSMLKAGDACFFLTVDSNIDICFCSILYSTTTTTTENVSCLSFCLAVNSTTNYYHCYTTTTITTASNTTPATTATNKTPATTTNYCCYCHSVF